MKNRIIAISLMLLSLCAATTIWANNEKPFVIPELRHWQGGEGVVNISDATKVIYTNAELANVAEALAKDYGLLFGKAMKAKITKSTIKSTTGAIVINLISDKELGDEGYSIDIADQITLNAQTATGAYWGTRTLLQIMEASKGAYLPKGSIRDWPDYPMRGFMIDCGRKYIPLEYLEKVCQNYGLLQDEYIPDSSQRPCCKEI